jgi:3-methyladenine DNA glycosylase AlkD
MRYCSLTVSEPTLLCHVKGVLWVAWQCEFATRLVRYNGFVSMSRAVLQVFANYQAARTTFVQTVAELAHRPQNIEALQNAGVMALLRPLLLDTVPSIQQSAALALGRLANYSEALAEAVVMNEVLPQLVYSLNEQNRFYKKTAAFVLKSVAKHSPELAQSVVEAGALDALVACLAEFEPSVKEAAAWALGYIARHTPDLAQAVIDAGAVPQLVLCLQEPELSLRRIAASTLSEICKHGAEQAQIVVDAGAIHYLAPMIQNPDAKLKRQVCSCLSQVAKHSIDLAEVVVEAEIFPKIFICLKDQDQIVRRNAATCVREIAKHTPELAHLIVNAGGHGAIIEYISSAKGASRLPGVMTLGYIAAYSETLALAVIVSQGIQPLKDALLSEKDDHIKAAAAWSLGQVGKHTPDHAKMLAQANVFPLLIEVRLRVCVCARVCMRPKYVCACYLYYLNSRLSRTQVYNNENNSADLRTKAQRAVKAILQKCTHLAALEPLLHDCPDKILKYVGLRDVRV